MLITIPVCHCGISQDLITVKAPAAEIFARILASLAVSASPKEQGKGVNWRTKIYSNVSKPERKHLQTVAISSIDYSKKLVCSHVLNLL